MNTFLRLALLAGPMMGSLVEAGSNTREQIEISTIDATMTNSSGRHSPGVGLGSYDFEWAAGLSDMSLRVVMPDGTPVYRNIDRTEPEILSIFHSHQSHISLGSAGQGLVNVNEVTNRVDRDGVKATVTKTDRYTIVSGDWSSFVSNGSRIVLEQTNASIRSTRARLEVELDRAARAKGGSARLLNWSQSKPNKIVADGQGLTASNDGTTQLTLETRTPVKRH
jgi:hypothetical protein